MSSTQFSDEEVLSLFQVTAVEAGEFNVDFNVPGTKPLLLGSFSDADFALNSLQLVEDRYTHGALRIRGVAKCT